jgi:hypothetical protein
VACGKGFFQLTVIKYQISETMGLDGGASCVLRPASYVPAPCAVFAKHRYACDTYNVTGAKQSSAGRTTYVPTYLGCLRQPWIASPHINGTYRECGGGFAMTVRRGAHHGRGFAPPRASATCVQTPVPIPSVEGCRPQAAGWFPAPCAAYLRSLAIRARRGALPLQCGTVLFKMS